MMDDEEERLQVPTSWLEAAKRVPVAQFVKAQAPHLAKNLMNTAGAIRLIEPKVYCSPNDIQRLGHVKHLKMVVQRSAEREDSDGDEDDEEDLGPNSIELSSISEGEWATEMSISIREDDTIVLYSENLGEVARFTVQDLTSMDDGTSLDMSSDPGGDYELDISSSFSRRLSKEDALSTSYQMMVTIYGTLFDDTKDLVAIDVAIECQRFLVGRAPSNDLSAAKLVHQLSQMYESRFKVTRDLKDIDRCISSARRSVDLSSSFDNGEMEDTWLFFEHLVGAHFERFELTRKPADINKFITSLRRGVEKEPTRTVISVYLADALERRSGIEGGSVADLDESIAILEDQLSKGHLESSRLLALSLLLGKAYNSRFNRTHRLEDLERAASIQRSILDHTTSDSSKVPILTNLGATLQALFQLGGQLSHLEEGISMTQKAILLTSDNSLRGILYNNLGVSFHLHFTRTRFTSDLHEAIEAGQKAVEMTADGDPLKPARWNNLGTCYYDRFQEDWDPTDLERAIVMHRLALDATPPSDGKLPHRRMGLANCIHLAAASGLQLRGLKDVDEAIALAEEAIGSSYSPDWQRSAIFNLGRYWATRHSFTGAKEDLEKSVELHRECVHRTGDYDAKRPLRLNNLAMGLLRLYTLSGEREHVEGAIRYAREGAMLPFGSPHYRIESAQTWAKASSHLTENNVATTLEAYDRLIELVSIAAGLEQTIELRHKSLEDYSHISLEAASAAFSFNRVDKAIEWLEEGRGLVWGQLNNLRAPIDELRDLNPQLASEVTRVSRLLEGAGMRNGEVQGGVYASMDAKAAARDEAYTHVQLAQEWETLLGEVRALSGFENFLRPASASSLLEHLPSEGFVIFINVSPSRCDALALGRALDHGIHVPLDDFSLSKAIALYSRLKDIQLEHGIVSRDTGGEQGEARGVRAVKKKGSSEEGDPPSNPILAILGDLWTLVVKPIFDALSLQPSQDPTRIWWCPTGPLTFLPLHAAGVYTPGECATVADYAVSSYTPTVSSLTSIVRAGASIMTKPSTPGLALVGQVETENMPSLPGTAQEVERIQDTLRTFQVANTVVLEGSTATPSGVQSTMETLSCVHLACHANQHHTDPLRSGFHLHGGMLTLSDLIKHGSLKDRQVDLAYLSACQTSTGHQALTEEAVHLAAGMLAAGYKGVVGTMWSIPDQYAPRVARYFYEDLLERGGMGTIDGSHAARALHVATQRLRDELGDSVEAFIAWIPFVHFGY